MVIVKNKGNKYISQTCRVCGKERLVRLVKGIPSSNLCHHCAVRTTEYRTKISTQIKVAYARGDYAT